MTRETGRLLVDVVTGSTSGAVVGPCDPAVPRSHTNDKPAGAAKAADLQLGGLSDALVLGADPDASVTMVIGSTGLAGAGTLFAYFTGRRSG